VNFNQCSDAALIALLAKVPLEVILPENTSITFVRENESVRQQFIVDDEWFRTISAAPGSNTALIKSALGQSINVHRSAIRRYIDLAIDRYRHVEFIVREIDAPVGGIPQLQHLPRPIRISAEVLRVVGQ
jgi:hypothetical protein